MENLLKMILGISILASLGACSSREALRERFASNDYPTQVLVVQVSK